jgi:Xaa-Pro aminopeptidase
MSPAVFLVASVLVSSVSHEEYAARRERLLEAFPEGIVLLHARSSPASLGEHRFKQDATFFYFTGLAVQPSAILALDGARKESILFVPEAPVAFGARVSGVSLPPGEESARLHGFTHVEAWEKLAPHLEKRLSEGIEVLYLDESRGPEMAGNPEPLLPMAGERALFRRSIEEAFPRARIESAAAAIRELRWVKSPAEVSVLREVARTSAAALVAGIRAVEPGVRQKHTELAVVSGCIESGASGFSFWPWTMSGPNAHVGELVKSMYAHDHLDRAMAAGELVRMDVGCELGHYEGDVGRTVPVSGTFTAEQRETWNLLIRAYRAGLSAMRAGVTLPTVMEAARDEVARAESSLASDYARRAAAFLREAPLRETWHIHGVGLDGGETGADVLESGSVVAFEPMFAVDADAYYLEDMILVTESGHEVLTKGLPYTADEVEAVLAGN